MDLLNLYINKVNKTYYFHYLKHKNTTKDDSKIYSIFKMLPWCSQFVLFYKLLQQIMLNMLFKGSNSAGYIINTYWLFLG